MPLNGILAYEFIPRAPRSAPPALETVGFLGVSDNGPGVANRQPAASVSLRPIPGRSGVGLARSGRASWTIAGWVV